MRAHRAPSLHRLGYLLVAAVAAAMFLVVTMHGSASGAGAGGGQLKYVTLSKAVPNKDIGRTNAFVDCPGSHPDVTGGGMEFTNGIQGQLKGDRDPLDLEVATTIGQGANDGWIAHANNNTGFPSSMTATAICAKGQFVYRPKFGDIPGHGQGILRVLCPPGTKLSGGGVETGSILPQVAVASSEPIDGPDSNSKRDDGWLGVASNGRPGSVDWNIEAVCAKSGSYKYVRSPKSTVPDNSQGTDGVACPAGTKVSGGGVDITGESVGIEVGGTFPSDRGDIGVVPDDGWDAVANNDDTGHAEEMRVFGICRA